MITAQFFWEVALGLYLVWVLLLWQRPVPLQGVSWSYEGLTLVLSQFLVFSLLGLLEMHNPGRGWWPLVALVTWTVGWWIAYFALRWTRSRGDRLLLPLACLLSGLGWVMQLRLDLSLGINQACWIMVGSVSLLILTTSLHSLNQLQNWTWPLALVCLGLQSGLFLFGQERNGAALWYELGPFSFQPVEIVKVLVVCLLAILLTPASQDPGKLTRPVLAVMGASWLLIETLLILQKDLGPALLFSGLFLVMLYLVSGRYRWVVGLLGLSTVCAWAANSYFAHVRVRVEAWLDPLGHYSDSGYQISQALFALARGAWLGLGLGLGEPGRIPEAPTDFIYVAWCEEMGTLGGILLWAVLTLFLLRCFHAAEASKNTFERVLAVGLACLMSWQSVVVLFGILKLTPMTGITLPFISYGGSSLLSNFVILALLLKMSRREF